MKKNTLKLIIMILIILVLCLCGYIIYDKTLNRTENNINSEILNKLNNIPKEIGNNDESKNYFTEYLMYIPLRYIDSKLSDYNISNLTKEEISMSVWRYIYYNDNSETVKQKSKEEIDVFLKKYFNFDNYEVKQMKIYDSHIFGLEKKSNYYVATVAATEFSFANFEITNISYDKNSQKVIINADEVYYEMESEEKSIISTVTIEFTKNENNFNVIDFKVDKYY